MKVELSMNQLEKIRQALVTVDIEFRDNSLICYIDKAIFEEECKFALWNKLCGEAE